MRFIRTKLRYILLSIFIVGVLVMGLEITNKTNFFHRQLVSSTIEDTSREPEQTERTKPTTSTDKDSSATNTSNPEKTSTPPTGGTTLTAPSGSFVSNHNVDLSNSETTRQESICTTTVGASCTITLKLGAVVKTLEAKTVGTSGTVLWTWDVKDAGLVPGSWEVIATASLNGQSKSTADLQHLEIR